MNPIRWSAAALLLAASLAHGQTDPAPASFAWRAGLDTATHSGLVRAAVPAEALARLQTNDAADLRVFDGSGRAVPFALSRPALPAQQPRAQTQAFAALALHAAQPGAAAPKGSVQLRVEDKGQSHSVWVQLGADGTPPAPGGSQPLQAALFDTRAQKDPLTGLLVRARVPANTPVHFGVASSTDLATWTPVPAQGRVFRFEGEGAPANDRLELTPPLTLTDRFLRLTWSGQEGVQVDAVVGLLHAPQPAPAYPALALPAPAADGPSALEWTLGFATPIARLEIASTRDNTVLPLRLLGRNAASEPWRLLAGTLVYRLGPAEQASSNPAVVLPRASVRWLRMEATHGARLDPGALAVRVLFEPLEVVFPAGDGGPYTLAAGRAATPSAALPLGMLAATTSTPLTALPEARLGAVQSTTESAGPWVQWLPRGVDGKTAALWLVLGVGVLALGGVAWALLRQLNAGKQG